MKYKRNKPNHEPWKRKPTPAANQASVDLPQIADVIALIAPQLQAVQSALDMQCAIIEPVSIDSTLTYNDKIVCATCGRCRDEVAP